MLYKIFTHNLCLKLVPLLLKTLRRNCIDHNKIIFNSHLLVGHKPTCAKRPKEFQPKAI
jgi:hypothetical protein